MSRSPIRVAILDDNFAVRQALKIVAHRVVQQLGFEVEVYSAADGVEGIGYALVTTPDIIIIDTTLPKYSGREVIEYLSTNAKFMNTSIKVIAISDGSNQNNGQENFHFLKKQDDLFIKELSRYLSKGLANEYQDKRLGVEAVHFTDSFLANYLGVLIWLATLIDNYKSKLAESYFIPKKLFYFLLRGVLQLWVNFFLVGMHLFVELPREVNKLQAQQDVTLFRLRTYPLTIFSIAVGMFLLFQFVLVTILAN